MELKFVLESILFSAQQPMAPKELRDLLVTTAGQEEAGGDVRAFKKISVEAILTALEQLAQEHEQAGRSYRLAGVAGNWQFVSQPEYAPWIKTLVGHKGRPSKLSQPALETLAIIAYRQPLTRAEIEQIRGVAVDGVMQTLLERGLVEPVARAEVIGRPMTYGTTPAFLEYFGLKSLEDLPAAAELRRVVVTKPESLLTVDPGLATAPPEQLTIAETADEMMVGNAGPKPGQAREPGAPAATESAPVENPPAPPAEAAPENRLAKRRRKPENAGPPTEP